jgi:hypothetical protein
LPEQTTEITPTPTPTEEEPNGEIEGGTEERVAPYETETPEEGGEGEGELPTREGGFEEVVGKMDRDGIEKKITLLPEFLEQINKEYRNIDYLDTYLESLQEKVYGLQLELGAVEYLNEEFLEKVDLNKIKIAN